MSVSVPQLLRQADRVIHALRQVAAILRNSHPKGKNTPPPQAARGHAQGDRRKAKRTQRGRLPKEVAMPPSEEKPRVRAAAVKRRRASFNSATRRRRNGSGTQTVRNAGRAPESSTGTSSKSQSEARAASSRSREGAEDSRIACEHHRGHGHQPDCVHCISASA